MLKAESSRDAFPEFYEGVIVAVSIEILMTDSSVVRKRAGSKENSRHFLISQDLQIS